MYIAAFATISRFFLTVLKRQSARRKFILSLHLKRVQRRGAFMLLYNERTTGEKSVLVRQFVAWDGRVEEEDVAIDK